MAYWIYLPEHPPRPEPWERYGLFLSLEEQPHAPAYQALPTQSEQYACHLFVATQGATAITSISGGSDADPARPTGFLRPLGEIDRLVRRKLADGSLFVLPPEGCSVSFASQRRCVVCGDAVESGTECQVIDEGRGLVVAHFACHTLWARQSREIRWLHESPGGRS